MNGAGSDTKLFGDTRDTQCIAFFIHAQNITTICSIFQRNVYNEGMKDIKIIQGGEMNELNALTALLDAIEGEVPA